MMIYVLEFLLLFSGICCGVLSIGRLQDESSEKCAAWAAAAGFAGLLCFFNNSGKSAAVTAAALLAVILVISKFLYHLDWKLLLCCGCSYLSVLLLTDVLSYLILCRYFSVPLVYWLVFLLLCRVPFYFALFASHRFQECISNFSNYYTSIYGTPAVAFCGISILLHMAFAGRPLDTLTIVTIVMLSALFLRIVLAYSHIEYQREKELLDTIEMQKELLEQNYAAVNKAYSQNAKLFHDFHRHLEVIHQMADRYHAPELSQYIDSIISPVQNISSMVWTGSQTVDYIINSRYEKAKNAGIRMEMNIEYPYNTNIKSNDLCTILSNLLDNALEAAAIQSRKTSPDTCSINLTIRRIQNILVIKLENSSPEPKYTSDGELVTVKKENEPMLHGWGMKNIEAAVQKYDGILQTAYADHIFQTTITMCFEGIEMDSPES